MILKSAQFETPLGAMLAVTDDASLYFLGFCEKGERDFELERLQLKLKAKVVAGESAPTRSIDAELKAYFAGSLSVFKTPIKLLGTPFQQQVWTELCQTPYGTVRSYADEAKALGRATAYRAVANANGANPLCIVVPCHRIIQSNGGLGGYSSGIERKKWLLAHEKVVLQ
jgi:AraC family transcriptional regulator of adaptative response/methylated-DNA-[protein]-cysteine methyltransferase